MAPRGKGSVDAELDVPIKYVNTGGCDEVVFQQWMAGDILLGQQKCRTSRNYENGSSHSNQHTHQVPLIFGYLDRDTCKTISPVFGQVT